jgi:hypothetical protein
MLRDKALMEMAANEKHDMIASSELALPLDGIRALAAYLFSCARFSLLVQHQFILSRIGRRTGKPRVHGLWRSHSMLLELMEKMSCIAMKKTE